MSPPLWLSLCLKYWMHLNGKQINDKDAQSLLMSESHLTRMLFYQL